MAWRYADLYTSSTYFLLRKSYSQIRGSFSSHLYHQNHSSYFQNTEYLVPISPSVINGLRGTVLSRYHGSSFEEDPTLVKSVIPILALFTWICNAQAISTLCSPKVFYVLCEVIKNYSQDACICHVLPISFKILFNC